MPKVSIVHKYAKVSNRLLSRSPRTKYNEDSPARRTVAKLQNLYGQNSSAANAVSMEKYMKNKFKFYGLKSPIRRSLDKQILSEFAEPSRDDVKELLALLWQCEERECQYFAIDVARKQRDLLCGGVQSADGQTGLDAAQCIGRLITAKSWWDTVDLLASNVIGHFVRVRPELVSLMDSWVVSGDLWLRRTALLHQLAWQQDTDSDRLFRYCSCCLHEREFFIEKAIGWSLRQHFKVDPVAVKTFVAENEEKMAKLSRREALKHA